jgi:RimJ/RimL family protein N-acetyltransferase
MLTVTSAVGTDRLLLRPYRPEDLDDVYAIQSDADVVRYLYWDVRTRQEVKDVLTERATLTTLQSDDDVLALAVERRVDGRVIGGLTLWLRSVEHRQGEIGFGFHAAAQGHGYAREAAAALLDMAFIELRLHRVYGRTDARNVRSAALMRRLHMRQEAHFHHNEIFKGEWGSELIFAVLEDEWAARDQPARQVDSKVDEGPKQTGI